jgi:beta-glucosidase
MGWNIDPQGMTDLLLAVSQRYRGLPLIIMENGAAFEDEVADDGQVHDAARVAYLHDHVEAVAAARDAGAPVVAYHAWSAMDNFEWAHGYAKRFGLIRVDFDTLERTWKDSARWYQALVTTGSVPPA